MPYQDHSTDHDVHMALVGVTSREDKWEGWWKLQQRPRSAFGEEVTEAIEIIISLPPVKRETRFFHKKVIFSLSSLCLSLSLCCLQSWT